MMTVPDNQAASSDAVEGNIARSLETIENAYNFVSDAGPLKNCGEWIYLKRLLAATPKPAPDAMQTLIERFPEINPGNYNDHDVEALNNWGIEVVAALSAPVPSPDGANGVEIRWQRVNGEHFEYAIQQGPYGDTFVSLLNGTCLRRPLSPAGAAEPDAVRSWEVSISINGENALTIGHSHLSGRDDIDRYAEVVRNCARHLIAFIDGKDLDLGAPAPAVPHEQHTARFLARLFYYRGVAYGKGVESADAWVDANWRFFLGDARRLGGIAPAVGVTTRKKRAEQIQSILAETLVIQDGEVVGTGAASYKIADALSPAVGVTREAIAPIAPIERVECVKFDDDLVEVPADPIWRLEIGGICADFPTETWANNFRKAILSLSPVPDATVSAERTPEQIEISKCWDRLEESGFPPEASGWPFQDIRGELPNAIDAALDCLIRQREDLLAEVTKLRVSSPQDVGREATIETFAKSLEVRAAGYAARGDSIFNGSIIAEELTEQVRRLRSFSGNGGGRG